VHGKYHTTFAFSYEIVFMSMMMVGVIVNHFDCTQNYTIQTPATPQHFGWAIAKRLLLVAEFDDLAFLMCLVDG
jgi:hypothetical protein